MTRDSKMEQGSSVFASVGFVSKCLLPVREETFPSAYFVAVCNYKDVLYKIQSHWVSFWQQCLEKVAFYMCVCVFHMLWEHKSVHTVTLWDSLSFWVPKTRPHNHKSLNIRWRPQTGWGNVRFKWRWGISIKHPGTNTIMSMCTFVCVFAFTFLCLCGRVGECHVKSVCFAG